MRLFTCLLFIAIGGHGAHAQMPEMPTQVRLRNATGINTEHLEFSPMFYEEGIVFVSSRRQVGLFDETLGETYFELYYAELDLNDMPVRPDKFSLEISSELHEGPVSFGEDGEKIFFTRSNMENGVVKPGADGKVKLKIYRAERGAFDWENIKELLFNNDDYSCMHPSLSEDGKRLYFVSDRPGGFGGWDIYFVDRDGEGWTDPINMGPDVNTSKNEVFPYIHSSGALFFSSDGHPGNGGLDLFMIDVSTNQWGEVTALPDDFNSDADDFGLLLEEDGMRGYFTSNRSGGFGKDDIYVFEALTTPLLVRMAEEEAEAQLEETAIEVVDAETGREASNVSIRIYERNEDGVVNDEELYNLDLVPASGQSGDLRLKLIRKQEDELGDPAFVTDDAGVTRLRLERDKEYLILVSKPGFQTQEIIYDPDSRSGAEGVKIQLEPNRCVSLSGYVLSETYGVPIPNALIRIVNGCNGEETTVRSGLDGRYEYCLDLGCGFSIRGEKQGYRSTETSLSTERVRGSRSFSVDLELDPLTEGVVRKPLREGTVIVLEDIYYDFNKSAIRSGAARELTALARLMKIYPSMQIELGAHTDARGPDDYNLALSLRRAESAKQFLVRKGISPFRIKAFGYGEARLRNECNDGRPCTEDQHQYNRRTEVRVIKIDEPVDFQYNDQER